MSAAMDHYIAAESALAEAEDCSQATEGYWLGKAQVHATLALAATQMDREQVTA